MKKILVTGAFGLVGTDLTEALLKKNLKENIVALTHQTVRNSQVIVEKGDITNVIALEKIINKHKITEIYHLAGLLSVGSEKNPQLAWEINLGGLKHILDLAVEYNIKVFWPSSIAAFGPTTPKISTPQHTILEPTTMYGVNKVAGELLCQYYFLKYGLDVRSLRYPGLIGYKAPPGDGTTEYAIHVFYQALKSAHYTFFLKKDSCLPMMYMDDAVNGTIQLMNAPRKNILIRTSYNFAAFSFTPYELAKEISSFIPRFTYDFKPDHRQVIADSWPKSIDDSSARKDWGWKHTYSLEKMAREMWKHIKEKLVS